MEQINLKEKQQNICLSQKKVVPLRAFCRVPTFISKLIKHKYLWQHYNLLEIMAPSCLL